MIIEQKENIVSFDGVKVKVPWQRDWEMEGGREGRERSGDANFSFYIVRSLETVYNGWNRK